MRHVLHTQPFVWELEGVARATWLIAEEMFWAEDENGEWAPDSWFVGENFDCAFKVSPRLQSWKNVLWRHFAPTFDEELSRRALCVGKEHNHLEKIEVKVETPTNHEILEARAALRDWCWDFGAPKEFARLMEL